MSSTVINGYGTSSFFPPHSFPPPFFFTALQTPNPKNKTSYHRSNKDRNAENASYIHVQRDAVRTVSLNAPPCSRPTHGFYNKINANKEPKLNLCPGGALDLLVCGLLSLRISWWSNEPLLLPPPLFLFQAITTSWENQWQVFFHMWECMWFKGCEKNTLVQMTWHWRFLALCLRVLHSAPPG